MRKRNVSAISTRPYAPAAAALPVSWGYIALTVLCAAIMAAGFFLAARQHFNTMELGMKNSKLRKQVEDLASENRRLTLGREISSSPAEIARVARSRGYQKRSEIAPAQVPAPAVKTQAKPAEAKAASVAVAKSETQIQKASLSIPAGKPATERNVKKIVHQKEAGRETIARFTSGR